MVGPGSLERAVGVVHGHTEASAVRQSSDTTCQSVSDSCHSEGPVAGLKSPPEHIFQALSILRPVAWRMRLLDGMKASLAPPAPTGKSPAPPRATRHSIVATLLLLAVGVSGCSSAGFSAHDVNLRASGDTLYLVARSGHVSRNLCASLGGDVMRSEGRQAAGEGRTIQLDRVVGCYAVRHIIVCPEEDAACLAHEERHRLEGAFHR